MESGTDKVLLFSTHCPKCKVVELKLNQKGVNYTLIDDSDKVIAYGKEHNIIGAPILEVNGITYDFANAVKYINALSDIDLNAVNGCAACK